MTTIIFPGLFDEKPGWNFDTLQDPFDLFLAIDGFTEKLNIAPSYPFRVARELAEQTFKYKPGDIPAANDSTPVKYWEPFLRESQSAFDWMRDPTKDERSKKFVHAFDKRGMFLKAARAGFFSLAGYEELEGLRELPKNASGIVEVEPVKISTPLIPGIAPFLQDLLGERKMLSTAYINFLTGDSLSDLGGQSVKIKRAWLAKQPIKLFEPWAARIAAAVEETRGTGEAALDAVNSSLKSVYTGFFGALAKGCDCDDCTGSTAGVTKCARSGWAAAYFRPDWRTQIVTLANANMFRNILEIFRGTGLLPFGLYRDSVLYFSDDERADMQFAGTSLMKENVFKHEWTLPAKKVIKAIKDGAAIGDIQSGDFTKFYERKKAVAK
jgi:hypothetical protein